MSLKERITEDMKAPCAPRIRARLSAVRLLLAAIKQREVDERIQLSDADVVAVIDKMLKQRRDSIGQYEAAQRQDLADAEKFEVRVLQRLHAAGAWRGRDRGRRGQSHCRHWSQGSARHGQDHGRAKPRLAGRADMAKVSALVKTKLAG